jgi:NADH-quinone oxidoreductase subunit H
VVVDFVVLGLSLGGWGANARKAVDVYCRVVAQLGAYVVPLGLAYTGAIMMAESLSTVKIVEAQKGLWFIVAQPIGFALYIITGMMQCFRAPFSRAIDHGVAPVYGGWMGIFWRFAMSGLLFIVAAMGAILYLGGWLGSWLPGPVWMLIKTYGLMLFMIRIGRRVEPLSTHRMLELSWKILTPVGLVNVLIVGGLILLEVGVK